MATSSITSDLLIANPTLDAHPARYSAHDGEDNINRFVQQFRFFLRWRPIQGQLLEIRGHSPSPVEVEAAFYDHSASVIAPISAQNPYRFAAPSAQPGPTQQLALKEITARFDSRTFSQHLLSRDFNQVRFQKRALSHAICARLEFGLVNGDSSQNPAEFDGLHRLVQLGLGQQLSAGVDDQLNILDEAMTLVRANRRCNLIVMNQNAWRRVLELQRARGFRPRFRRDPRLRQPLLVINGVPVCLTDHIQMIPNADGVPATSVFFLSMHRPNGVFGLVSRKRPRIFFTRTSRQDDPFQSYQAHLFSALASATSDALVEVTNWNVQISSS